MDQQRAKFVLSSHRILHDGFFDLGQTLGLVVEATDHLHGFPARQVCVIDRGTVGSDAVFT